ncbi:uncharacterized protein I303_102551 [Kwoniella dejecticola CBS 10117]|uniref:Uncharacterized protein n=1 Tax=Kwoniella dejecticola CBS 10117 TaxID=1296121 RepID=A0A1A6A927_9TREE|nr:uncharacterized protein I303_02565 [Kwoniella dejecticola CBS 10117]OBR86557.1 hypothetical protein I303_02565 [Kwoniella dejecticola CBS 10117]
MARKELFLGRTALLGGSYTYDQGTSGFSDSDNPQIEVESIVYIKPGFGVVDRSTRESLEVLEHDLTLTITNDEGMSDTISWTPRDTHSHSRDGIIFTPAYDRILATDAQQNSIEITVNQPWAAPGFTASVGTELQAKTRLPREIAVIRSDKTVRGAVHLWDTSTGQFMPIEEDQIRSVPCTSN